MSIEHVICYDHKKNKIQKFLNYEFIIVILKPLYLNKIIYYLQAGRNSN